MAKRKQAGGAGASATARRGAGAGKARGASGGNGGGAARALVAKAGAGARAKPGATRIRPARRSDVPGIWELIRGLSVYEKLEHRVTGGPGPLREHLFGARPIIRCLVAEEGGRLVGSSIYYLIYSTFRTQPMMWLEDLFVVPEHRGRGTGKQLLLATAREAERLGCWRLSWAVLEWNEPAIGFYERMGATRDEGGWYVYQLDEAKLRAIAAETGGR